MSILVIRDTLRPETRLHFLLNILLYIYFLSFTLLNVLFFLYLYINFVYFNIKLRI